MVIAAVQVIDLTLTLNCSNFLESQVFRVRASLPAEFKLSDFNLSADIR